MTAPAREAGRLGPRPCHPGARAAAARGGARAGMPAISSPGACRTRNAPAARGGASAGCQRPPGSRPAQRRTASTSPSGPRQGSRMGMLATGGRIRNTEAGLMQASPGAMSHLPCGPGVRAIQPGFPVADVRSDKLPAALRVDAHLPPARPGGRTPISGAPLPVDEMGHDPPPRPRRARHRARTGGASMARSSPPTSASATGPIGSPATRCWPPPSSAACSTAPMSSTSSAAASGCASGRWPTARERALRRPTVSAPPLRCANVSRPGVALDRKVGCRLTGHPSHQLAHRRGRSSEARRRPCRRPARAPRPGHAGGIPACAGCACLARSTCGGGRVAGRWGGPKVTDTRGRQRGPVSPVPFAGSAASACPRASGSAGQPGSRAVPRALRQQAARSTRGIASASCASCGDLAWHGAAPAPRIADPGGGLRRPCSVAGLSACPGRRGVSQPGAPRRGMPCAASVARWFPRVSGSRHGTGRRLRMISPRASRQRGDGLDGGRALAVRARTERARHLPFRQVLPGGRRRDA